MHLCKSVSMCQKRILWPKLSGFRKCFSTYADYTDRARIYNEIRQPVGQDLVKKSVATLRKQKSDMGGVRNSLCALDAGCGTGNYVELLYNCGVDKIVGIDANKDMIAVCKEKIRKFNKEKSNINILTHNICILDFLSKKVNENWNNYNGDNEYDCILFNQVLHHLDNEETKLDNHYNIRLAFEYCYSLIKPSGCLIINTSLPHQSNPGLWFHQFISQTSEIYCQRFPRHDFFLNQLNKAQFSKIETYTLDESPIRLDFYYQFERIADRNWRICDSSFEMCPENEILNAIEMVNKIILQNEETKMHFIKQSELIRKELGLTTTYIAWK